MRWTPADIMAGNDVLVQDGREHRVQILEYPLFAQYEFVDTREFAPSARNSPAQEIPFLEVDLVEPGQCRHSSADSRLFRISKMPFSFFQLGPREIALP